MGVYNPNADMPVSCAVCDTRGGSNCFLSNLLSYPDVLRRRHPDCPLVEVKEPHGDLIDRTALIKEARVICSYDDDGVEFECMGVLDGALVDAPTVIEAEGNDEDCPPVEAQDECYRDSCPIQYSADEFFSAERSDGR